MWQTIDLNIKIKKGNSAKGFITRAKRFIIRTEKFTNRVKTNNNQPAIRKDKTVG